VADDVKCADDRTLSKEGPLLTATDSETCRGGAGTFARRANCARAGPPETVWARVNEAASLVVLGGGIPPRKACSFTTLWRAPALEWSRPGGDTGLRAVRLRAEA
jgi:hypothetical protein